MKHIESNLNFGFFKKIGAIVALSWTGVSFAADYNLTFEVTVNERRTVNSYSPVNSFRGDYGQLDASFTPYTFTTQYLLKTADLKPGTLWGANDFRAWSAGLGNLQNSLYDGVRPAVIPNAELYSIQEKNSEIYVRSAFASEVSAPQNSWVGSALYAYEDSYYSIAYDETSYNVHTYESKSWESSTTIFAPSGINYEPEHYSVESLLAFLTGYQAIEGARFSFSSVGQYDHAVMSVYNPYSMDYSYVDNNHLTFLQVGYVGSARLLSVSAVPLPSAAVAFVSALCALWGFGRRRRAAR